MAEQPRPWTNFGKRTLSPARWIQTLAGMIGEPELPSLTWSWGVDPLGRRALLAHSYRGGRTAVISFAVNVSSSAGPWMITTHDGGPTCITPLPRRLVLDRIRSVRVWLLEEAEPEPQ